MKKTILLSLAIRFCSASLLFAQTTAQVQKADLAIPFGTVSGKIIMAGDHLVFIDEERPGQSFVVARSEVEELAIQDGTASLECADRYKIDQGRDRGLVFGWLKAKASL